MRRYRTQDLSITVLPESGIEDCYLGTNICLDPTLDVCPRDATICPQDATVTCPNLSRWCGQTFGCPNRTFACPNGTRICPGGTGGCGVNYSYPIGPPRGPITVREPRELERLKEDLRRTLDELDQVDPDDLGGGARDIQSLEEAEELEARLRSALEDVQQRKEELGPGQGKSGA